MRKALKNLFGYKDKVDFYSEIIRYTRLYPEGDGYIEVEGVISVADIRRLEVNPEDLSTTLMWIKGTGDPVIVGIPFADLIQSYQEVYAGYLLNQQITHGN